MSKAFDVRRVKGRYNSSKSWLRSHSFRNVKRFIENILFRLKGKSREMFSTGFWILLASTIMDLLSLPFAVVALYSGLLLIIVSIADKFGLLEFGLRSININNEHRQAANSDLDEASEGSWSDVDGKSSTTDAESHGTRTLLLRLSLEQEQDLMRRIVAKIGQKHGIRATATDEALIELCRVSEGSARNQGIEGIEAEVAEGLEHMFVSAKQQGKQSIHIELLE
jgi:hypothetical protein